MIAKDMEKHPGKLPTIQDFLFKMRTQLLVCIEFINDLNEQSHAERNIIYTNALCSKSNGSYDIKDFGTLSLIFFTSKNFRRKCQPCPSFFSHPNIPDKWKRAQLSLDQMKKKERVKVKS